MQFTHSTLYLIYLIRTGSPWNTYHNSVKKNADTTIDLQFWSEAQAVKKHIIWCVLHICHMWYFLSIFCMCGHFPNVELSDGSQEKRHREWSLSPEKAPPIFIACPGEVKWHYGWEGPGNNLDLVQPLSKLVTTLLFSTLQLLTLF